MSKLNDRKNKGWFGFFSNVKLLLEFSTIGNIKKSLILIFTISVFVSLVSPILAYFTKVIVDVISANGREGGIYRAFNKAVGLLAVTVCITLAISVLNFLKDRISIKMGIKAAKTMNKIIMDKISVICRDQFEEPETYNLINRIKNNLGAGCHKSMLSIIEIISNLISVFSFGILIFNIKWYFAGIITAFNILYILIGSKNSFEKYYLEVEQSQTNRKMDYVMGILADRAYNHEIRAFGLADYLINKFESLQNSLQRQSLIQLIRQRLLVSGFWVFSQFGLFLCLFILGNMIASGEATIGDFILIMSASGAFAGAFTNAISGLLNINMQLVYLEDWNDFINLQGEKCTETHINERFDIKFDNVSFTYPAADRDSIKNINCNIRFGETIALVGENGSGKTTFINLLLGLFRPRTGNVLINHMPVEDVLASYRKHISCIFQNFGKYQMSILENLKLANESIDVNTIKDKQSMLDFVEDFPQGYDTFLGQLDRGGRELSGGQWQRIAIQRAILRPDTTLLIMDEPAASLDPVMESELYEEFGRIAKGKTTIITSHRLGSCALADRIFVFSGGEIVEEGCHDALMTLKGKYYEMYTRQRSLYSNQADADSNNISA